LPTHSYLTEYLLPLPEKSTSTDADDFDVAQVPEAVPFLLRLSIAVLHGYTVREHGASGLKMGVQETIDVLLLRQRREPSNAVPGGDLGQALLVLALDLYHAPFVLALPAPVPEENATSKGGSNTSSYQRDLNTGGRDNLSGRFHGWYLDVTANASATTCRLSTTGNRIRHLGSSM